MRKYTKKTVAIATGTLVLLAGTGVAFAYWTTTGSGTGTAATGTVVGITVNQTSTVTNMHPGDSAQELSGTFDNDNDGPVYVATVTASIDSVDKAGGAPSGDCDASDYTLANAVATVDDEIAAGDGVGTWSGPDIKFNNTASNQDACKGATVNLAYLVG